MQFPSSESGEYDPAMTHAKEILDQQFLEMRWRCLSLAADLDRLSRAPGGAEALAADPRLERLAAAIAVLLESTSDRAEKVQRIFSDMSSFGNKASD
jgi:hypothetical protein